MVSSPHLMVIPGNGVIFLPRPVGGAGPWYNAGGCPNPVACWQPKAADGWTPANIVASYVNRANPGTYDAAPGTAPAWAAATGWTFTAASLQYLTTGLVPAGDQSWSIVLRYAGSAVNGGMGCHGTKTFGFYRDGSNIYYFNGGQINVAPTLAAGTIAVGGNRGYRNGVVEGGVIGNPPGAQSALFIGAMNNGAGVPEYYWTVTITALAVWNVNVGAYMAALHARLIAVGL